MGFRSQRLAGSCRILVTSLFKWRRKRLISILEEELEAVPSGVRAGGAVPCGLVLSVRRSDQ